MGRFFRAPNEKQRLFSKKNPIRARGYIKFTFLFPLSKVGLIKELLNSSLTFLKSKKAKSLSFPALNSKKKSSELITNFTNKNMIKCKFNKKVDNDQEKHE